MDKRLGVIVLAALLAGGGVILAVKLLQPPKVFEDDPVVHRKLPELGKPDAALLAATPLQQPKFLPFVDASSPSVKRRASLAAGKGVLAAAFSPDGHFLVTGGYGDMSLRVFSWYEELQVSEAQHKHRLTSLAISSDGATVWTGDAYQNLYRWPLSPEGLLGRPELVGEKLGHMMHVAVSPNGRLVATSSFDKILSLWDAGAGKQLSRVTLETPLRACEFSPDGARLAATTNTNLFALYEVATGQGRMVPIPPLKPGIDTMSVGFSPDGKYFSTGHNQPWITVWDAPATSYQRFLKCPETGGITALAYTRDSKWVVFGLGAGEIHLWSPEDGSVAGSKAVFKTGDAMITDLAFSPDGSVLAAADEAGNITLWGK